MTEQRTCKGMTARGEPCKGFALPGSDYCLSHDPAHQEALRASRAKGGANASKLRALRGKRAKLDTLPALVKFTAGVIQDVLGLSLPVDVGRCVLYGLSIQRDLVETSDLEARVVALEQGMAARTAGRGWSA